MSKDLELPKEWDAPHDLTGCIFTSDGWVNGTVHFQETVQSVKGDSVQLSDYDGDVFIIPGFIDLHVHGGHGHDVMQGRNATQVMVDYHATQGTVALTPTTMTAPTVDIETALSGIKQVMDTPSNVSPEILGAHLEGPFISPNKLGAQPDHAVDCCIKKIDYWNSICPIRIMTVAPEVTGAETVAKFAHDKFGTRVQIGHTVADYECCKNALCHGSFSGATHIYNAMSGLSHRGAGALAGVLSHADYAEIILDKKHVDRGSVNVARRAVPFLYSVTDATSAAGQPDGEYALGEHTVYKKGDTVTLSNGKLAGSCMTMAQAFKNWLDWGDDMTEAVKRTSTYPAQYLGMTDKYGYVDVECIASLLVVNRIGDIQQIYIKGHPILWPDNN